MIFLIIYVCCRVNSRIFANLYKNSFAKAIGLPNLSASLRPILVKISYRAKAKKTRFLLTSGTILKNGLEARSTKDEFSCGTGILPVLESLFRRCPIMIVEQASCLFKICFSEEPHLTNIICIRIDTHCPQSIGKLRRFLFRPFGTLTLLFGTLTLFLSTLTFLFSSEFFKFCSFITN